MEFDGTEYNHIHHRLYTENDEILYVDGIGEIDIEKFKELYIRLIDNIHRNYQHEDLDELFAEEL